MQLFYRIVLFLFLITLTNVAVAQESNVTGAFNNLSFEKFAEAIESKMNYRFYFNPKFTDSLTVNALNAWRKLLTFHGTADHKIHLKVCFYHLLPA